MRHIGRVRVDRSARSSSSSCVKRKPPKRHEDMRQPQLLDVPAATVPPQTSINDLMFRCGDRRKLYVGSKPLDHYLADSGQSAVLRLAKRIDAIDLSDLYPSYSTLGRHALHPRILLGLMVFGTLMGKSSLRELEQLAVCDVRAWWLCRGEQPDHTTIAKFVRRHADWLAGNGFDAALKAAARDLGLSPGDAAIDGTVVEAAASRLGMLKKEAASAAAAEARHAAAKDPGNAKLQREAALAADAAAAVTARTESRASHGKSAEHVRVAPSDPDAVVQPRKDDAVRPSYKPSVIADRNQLIVAMHVDPSNEMRAVAPLLARYEQIVGAAPKTLLADAGFHTLEMLTIALDKSIDLLVPSGKAFSEETFDRASRKHYPKTAFTYSPEHDAYLCPAAHLLRRLGRERDRDERVFTKYGDAPCRSCPRRKQCTASAKGRVIKRYDGDELKEAMREVMKQPAARRKYRERSGIVEPVFARLQQMGLRRFRRRGLTNVRAEFALYCIAYNFKRADGIREARIAAFATIRLQDGSLIAVVMMVYVAPISGW